MLAEREHRQAEKARRSLSEFTRQAWHVLEPETPLVWNWHIDVMAEHLQAVSAGQIRKLLCNVPPGHMKSLMFCVMWPAWQWIDNPHWRMLFASYAAHLSERDTLKMRTLIGSPWYQRHFGEKFSVTKAIADKVYNDKTGFRIATSVGGVGTGERVHCVVNDDLVRANDDESEAKLAAALKHMKAMSTRGVNPATFAQVLIMQRISEDDPAGWAIEQGGWDQLILPAEYEPGRHCTTSIGFSDPRTQEGELLWPGMFPAEVIKDLKTALGSKDSSAQLQQNPVPPGGGDFKTETIQIVDALPIGCKFARGWDLASTTPEENPRADYTAGVLIARDHIGRFYIADARRGQLGPLAVEMLVQQTAHLDGYSVPISGPQDPGQAGKSQGKSFVSMLAGFDVEFTPETGEKRVRAKALAAQIEAGNVAMLRGEWNKDYLAELTSFPYGRHDDQVDASSRAFHKLITHTGGTAWA